mmetsp:Transcript_13951/g.16216  ORF Transcript_13951/g.16216 Transcript_13951/m.16216 type:complete len:493 (+) Transcript_13951:36-1514(+)
MSYLFTLKNTMVTNSSLSSKPIKIHRIGLLMISLVLGSTYSFTSNIQRQSSFQQNGFPNHFSTSTCTHHSCSSMSSLRMSSSSSSNHGKNEKLKWNIFHLRQSNNSNNKHQQGTTKTEISSSMSFDHYQTNDHNNKRPCHHSSIKSRMQSLIYKLITLNDVAKWRIAATAFITSIVAFSPTIDTKLIKLWSWLQNDTTSLLPRLFRHDHWEWVVAVSAFFFWIHGYWLVDRSIAKSDAKGVVHPWKKYRLQDQYEAEKFRRMQLRKTEPLEGKKMITHEKDLAEDDKNLKPPITKQHKWHLGFWVFELPLYCLPLYIWDIMIPRRAAKLATWGAPSAFTICRDVTCALLLYDLGFFVCHYLMHKIPFLYKYVHAKHHKSTEVRASDIVRLSGVEEVVDVGISILALNYLGCHPVSRTIYNIIITFLLTELHSGYAFPWTPQFVVPFGFATGSKGHHYHHRNGKHYYQKFFCHVDKWFGFVQKKDGTIQGASV